MVIYWWGYAAPAARTAVVELLQLKLLEWGQLNLRLVVVADSLQLRLLRLQLPSSLQPKAFHIDLSAVADAVSAPLHNPNTINIRARQAVKRLHQVLRGQRRPQPQPHAAQRRPP